MRRWSLRARLALLVAAGVLPLVAFNLTNAYYGYREERARASRQALSLAHGLALAVEDELRARIAVLEVLALSRPLADGDLATFRLHAEAVLARQTPGANILLLREDGQQLLNTAVPAGKPLPARRYLDNQRRIFATGQPSVSNVFVGMVLGRPLIAIDVPVRGADGRVAAVLALNPTLDAFEPLIRRQRPGAGWIVSIVDRTGVRVARLPDPKPWVGRPLTPELLHAWSTGAPEGTLETVSAEGAPVLAAFSRLPETGWGVTVAVPLAELTRPAWRSALVSLSLGAALLLLGIALARWLALGILRPVRALLRFSASLEAEGMDTAPLSALGLPEAERLATAQMAEARRRRAAMAAAIDSERRLRLVVAELNHRAKNALATVQSLALLTARSPAGSDPLRFTEAFTARLKSLARAHDLLAALSWEGAALDAILRAGLAPWIEADAEAADPRLLVACPGDLPLPQATPGQVQALVMALHELATNATKYGALSVPGGRVEILCRADPAGLAATIDWHERGGPPVSGPPARRGFGTRLLERALVRDLGPGASVRLDFEPAGLRATIRFVPRAAAALVA
ncbi:sensor histidine kinase [Dankookia sp. P2]|uniref:sensor histidine kinase n=1 Tax=Dankookia sp. P2 TaxID=3423955 RepID=UPI003D672FDA